MSIPTPPLASETTPATATATADADRAMVWGRVALVVVLAWLSLPWLADPARGMPDGIGFLHGISLGMHETGHIVFSPFGETMAVLGGTLLQLLFPIAFVGHFAWRRAWFAAAVCAWWVAQNGWDAAIYIADARAESLPLVGGGEHDWAWLLLEWNALGADHAIARAVHGAATLLAIGALAGAVVLAGRRARDVE